MPNANPKQNMPNANHIPYVALVLVLGWVGFALSLWGLVLCLQPRGFMLGLRGFLDINLLVLATENDHFGGLNQRNALTQIGSRSGGI